MYAILQEGSRQYRVEPGERIWVDQRPLAPGDSIVFDRVLATVDGERCAIGRPHLAGARVEGRVVGPVKAPKLISHQYRRRKKSHVRKGHRQKYTVVEITAIQIGEAEGRS